MSTASAAGQPLRIVFMGTPDFAVSSLEAIVASRHTVACVVTVPDRLSGRGQKLTPSPVKRYAEEHGIPLLQPEKLRDPQFLDDLHAVEADLFVVVAFRMLPRDVWALPPMGTFNLHASLLPQYRGAAPINWALINGETETGVTTFFLNERIDEGSIIRQESTAISPEDNAETLHDRLAAMGSQLVVETLDSLAEGSVQPKPQTLPTEGLRPAPKLFRADCLINWNRPGADIVNFIRGLSPYPAAHMELTDTQGRRHGLKVFSASFTASSPAAAGALQPDGRSFLRVTAEDGIVEIHELQLEGKRRMTTEDFLRGCAISDWTIDE